MKPEKNSNVSQDMKLVCSRQLGEITMLHSPLGLCLNEYKARLNCIHDQRFDNVSKTSVFIRGDLMLVRCFLYTRGMMSFA